MQVTTTHTAPNVGFMQALQFWFKLGCISFGGPAGQIAIMQRELVDERRWISQGRFNHALNYCMLLPGRTAKADATELEPKLQCLHKTHVRGGVCGGGLHKGYSTDFQLCCSAWPATDCTHHAYSAS
jgi:chromate transporter